MTKTVTSKDPLRYRAYYWLLNLSFVFALIGLAEFLTRFVFGKQCF